MLEEYLPDCRRLLDQCESLFCPTLRLTQVTEISSGTANSKTSALLYGFQGPNTPEPGPELSQAFPSLSLSFKLFESTLKQRAFVLPPGKISLVSFVAAITDLETSLLQHWSTLPTETYKIVLILDGSSVTTEAFPGCEVVEMTEELKKDFEVQQMPWTSVVYNQQEVYAGEMNSISVELLQKLIGSYSRFEALSICALGQMDKITVWDYEGKKERNIETDEIVVLDFWDDSSAEVLMSPIPNSAVLSYFQVYAGSQTPRKRCRYGLGVQGLMHPTAVMLKIVEVPTTVLISKGTVRWKGNKGFVDFKQLVGAFLGNEDYEREGFRIGSEDYVKIIERCVEENKESGESMGIKLLAQVEIEKERILEERFKAVVDLQGVKGEDKEKFYQFIEELRESLQNVIVLNDENGKQTLITEVENKDAVENEENNLKVEEIIEDPKANTENEPEFKEEINEIANEDIIETAKEEPINDEKIEEIVNEPVKENFEE
jgi:hypothetical protein